MTRPSATWPTTYSSPRAQFDLDLSGDKPLKGLCWTTRTRPTTSSTPDRRPWHSARGELQALGAAGTLAAHHQGHGAVDRAVCADCASRADALATRYLEELRGRPAQTTIHDAQANHPKLHSDALEAKARAFAQLDTVRALQVHADYVSGRAAPGLQHGRRGRRAKGDGGRRAAPGGGDEASGHPAASAVRGCRGLC